MAEYSNPEIQVNSKEKIIKHFENGNKSNELIGVENEKFLFEISSNKRADYNKIKNFFHGFFKTVVNIYLKDDSPILFVSPTRILLKAPYMDRS